MKTTVIILSILVGLLCLKWVLIALIYPFQAAFFAYKKKGGTFRRIAGFPYWLVEKLCRGGWQR